VPFVDLTALASLAETLERLEKHEVRVALCCANAEVAARLEKAGVTERLPVPTTVSLTEAIAAVGRRSV